MASAGREKIREKILWRNFLQCSEGCLLDEANPLGFIAEQAGGAASDGWQRVMEIQPKAMHDRTPLIIGSKDEVERVLSFLRQ